MWRQLPAGGRVTLKTIAELAGVHVATVSRALNPREAKKVHPETLRKVRALAEELGYEPDPWGRSLRTQRSLSIGLLLPRLVDGVLAIMFEAAEDRARSHGYQAVTTSTRDQPSEQRRLVSAMLERRVDGLILATPQIDDPLLPALEHRGVPFVIMNRSSDTYLSSCGNDELGGHLAASHLLEQGHRRIAMISGPRNVSTSAGRYAGYVIAHRDHNAKVDDSLVVAAGFTPEDGQSAMQALLGRDDPPTAVFAINDAAALGAMAAVRNAGLNVPDDIAIVGYNDSPMARMLPVPLTSVRVPVEDIATQAVELLIAVLNGDDAKSAIFEPSLIIRASSTRGAPLMGQTH